MTLFSTILLLLAATGLLAVWLGFGSRRIATLCICFGVVAMLASAGCREDTEQAEARPGGGQEGDPKGTAPGEQPADEPIDANARLDQLRERLRPAGDMQAFLQAIPSGYIEERQRWLRSTKQKRPEQADALPLAYDALLAQEKSRDEAQSAVAANPDAGDTQGLYGAEQMRALTGSNVGSPLAVLIDSQAPTPPLVRSEPSDAVHLSGDFSEEQVAVLLKAFNRRHAGRAP